MAKLCIAFIVIELLSFECISTNVHRDQYQALMWAHIQTQDTSSWMISFTGDKNGKYSKPSIISPELALHQLSLSELPEFPPGTALKETWQNDQHPQHVLDEVIANGQKTTVFILSPLEPECRCNVSLKYTSFVDFVESLDLPIQSEQESSQIQELQWANNAIDARIKHMEQQHKTQVLQLDLQLEKQNMQIATVQSELLPMIKQRETMQETLMSKDKEIIRLNATIQQQIVKIDELSKTQTTQDCDRDEISRLKQELNAKDKDISLLRQKMDSMKDGFTRRFEQESIDAERQKNDKINDLKTNYASKMSHAKVIWIIITCLCVLATLLILFGVFKIYSYCKRNPMEMKFNLREHQQRQDSMDINPGADVGDVRPAPINQWKSNQITREVNDIAARRVSDASALSDQLFNEEGNELRRSSKSIDILQNGDRNPTGSATISHNSKSLNKWKNKGMTKEVSDICRNRDRSISSDLFDDVKTNPPPTTMTCKPKSLHKQKSKEMTTKVDDICRNRNKSVSSDLFEGVTTKSGDETCLTSR